MKLVRISSIIVSLIILAACVTINIYFPAAEAKEAAEKIVDEILGDELKPQSPGTDEQSMWLPSSEPVHSISLLELVIPTAQAAAQGKFDADTPTVRRLQASMKKRHASLRDFYTAGAIGFTRDALVGVRELSAVPLKQRGQLKNLVKAENDDRNHLYKEIARANGHPEWEQDIRDTFSKTWIDKASKGWWYQDSKGSWVQK